MLFFWEVGTKVFWDTKGLSDFFGTPKFFFLEIQNVFRDTKFVLDIFGGQMGLINCKIVVDILEGQKRQGWVSQWTLAPKQQKKAEVKTVVLI